MVWYPQCMGRESLLLRVHRGRTLIDAACLVRVLVLAAAGKVGTFPDDIFRKHGGVWSALTVRRKTVCIFILPVISFWAEAASAKSMRAMGFKYSS